MECRTAEYPDEIVERLIKMFSIIMDTVLDPFLGMGTTTTVAKRLNRNSIGYEIDKKVLPIIKEKVGYSQVKLILNDEVVVIE